MTARTLAGLQSALGGENAAVYVYGIVGAYVSGAAFTRATNLWTAHKARRDDLRAIIAAAGAAPDAAEPAYRLPHRVTSASSAVSAAAATESSLISAYIGLAGADDPGRRVYAAQAMQQAMSRTLSWGGTVDGAFPGMPAGRPDPTPTTR
jgi:hypothetical protein